MAKRNTSGEATTGSAKAKTGRTARPKAQPVKATEAVYQLKISLRDIQPPIWRRVQVKDCTLADLHEIIQVAMGWEFAHLHSFRIHGVDYGDVDIGDSGYLEDERGVRLSDFVRTERFKFRYTYDFGDNWRHEIVVEKIRPPEEGTIYPECTAGKRAGPPEDVGGAWGYMEFIAAKADPNHPRHEEISQWYEDPFDPEAFDLDEVNGQLGGHW